MSDAFGRIIAEQGLDVPAVVARLHAAGSGRYRGRADIETGNALARLIVWIAGFPAPGRGVDFEIATTPQGEGHIWARRFGASKTRSYLTYDSTRGCAVEHFGPIAIRMGLRMRAEVLTVAVLGASFLGLPLPRLLTPQSAACEFETPDGGFGFDISASLPLVGLLIRYQGSFDVPALR
ncbi:DUF4166 domain-containing protein [Pseudophaeobacter arcticus]|jgi:hypothetical protein|uniref:DUF4166 domain-containing protein n=1 Tax=Pseudophaeobacter arcticus TaxID=385492 RepID=UPI0039E678EA